MALMHAIQSAHISLESGHLRILEMLKEEKPAGRNGHADPSRWVMLELPQRRPAILSPELGKAADETRRFRHRATHNYDGFDMVNIEQSIDAAL